MSNAKRSPVGGSRLHLLEAGADQLCDKAWAVDSISAPTAVARVVRGHKCRTERAFFDEFAAALQFPYYFGENWNAFDECLADLEWIRAEVCVIFLGHAMRMLEAEAGDKAIFAFQLIANICRTFGKLDSHDSARPPGRATALHIVWHCTPDDRKGLEKVLHQCGIETTMWGGIQSPAPLA